MVGSAAAGTDAPAATRPATAADHSTSTRGRRIAIVPTTSRTGTARYAGSRPATSAADQISPAVETGSTDQAATRARGNRPSAATTAAPSTSTAAVSVVSTALGSANVTAAAPTRAPAAASTEPVRSARRSASATSPAATAVEAATTAHRGAGPRASVAVAASPTSAAAAGSAPRPWAGSTAAAATSSPTTQGTSSAGSARAVTSGSRAPAERVKGSPTASAFAVASTSSPAATTATGAALRASGASATARHRPGTTSVVPDHSSRRTSDTVASRVAPSSSPGSATVTVISTAAAAPQARGTRVRGPAKGIGRSSRADAASRPRPWPSSHRARIVAWSAASPSANITRAIHQPAAPRSASQGSAASPRRRPNAARPANASTARAITTCSCEVRSDAPAARIHSPIAATACGVTSRWGNSVSASAPARSVPPTRQASPDDDSCPSQPALSAPTASRASSPSETRVSDSAATRRPRPASQTPRPAAVRVRATRTPVRPPTPSQDQATARKVTAATSRHSAPRPSRIDGTEAPRRPVRRGATAAATGTPAAGTGAGTAKDGASSVEARRSSRSRSAWLSVRNKETASGPWSGRAQAGQATGSAGSSAPQPGHRLGSA